MLMHMAPGFQTGGLTSIHRANALYFSAQDRRGRRYYFRRGSIWDEHCYRAGVEDGMREGFLKYLAEEYKY